MSDSTLQRMTPSRYKCFHECQRLHHYKYVLGIRPRKKARPLVYGTLVHCALEAWWNANKQGEGDHALSDAIDELEDHPLANDLDEFTFAIVRALVIGYDARWAPYMDQIEVLEVEAEYCGPMLSATDRTLEGWKSAGKLDVIYGFNGRVYGMEHKTSSADLSPDSWYWTIRRMDPQLSAYMDSGPYLCNGKKYELDGFVYDVIAKPKMKPYTAVDEPRYTKGTLCGTAKNPCIGRKCERCAGTTFKPCGSKKNPCNGTECDRCPGSGYLQPRLAKGQRLEDETLEEYRTRAVETICADPARWYHRKSVVRLQGEIEQHRADYWATALRIGTFLGNDSKGLPRHAPRNPDACFLRGKGNGCAFFGVCSGAGSLDSDEFEHVGPHPELEFA